MGRGGRGVRAVSDSSIEITFMYRGVRCRERITLKPTATNLKKAEQHKAAIEHAISIGTFDYSVTFPGSARAAKFAPEASRETVNGFLTRWLTAKEKHVASSTFDGYRKLVTLRLIPALGDTMLVDLKRKAVRDWLDTLEVSNKTLSNIQSCLRSALNDAAEEELIELNPLAGWTYSRKAAPPKEDDVDPFSPEEQQAVLGALSGQARNMMQFALWSGLRTSELVALDWGDIDWLREEVMVSRAMTQAGKGKAETTKTAAGRRSVKLLRPALEALKAQKAHTFLADAEVFQNPRTLERWAGDGPIRKTMWAPAMKKAGVRYRRPYQTRHTYVSVRPTHLPNSSIKDDGVRVFLSGRDSPYRRDFHAPTKLLPQTVQGPGCSGVPATRCDRFQRCHPPRHQCQRHSQVATALSRSTASGVAGVRSCESYAKTTS